jgi:hypothetical protein
MRVATADDRETNTGRSTYRQNFYYLLPARAAYCRHTPLPKSHAAPLRFYCVQIFIYTDLFQSIFKKLNISEQSMDSDIHTRKFPLSQWSASFVFSHKFFKLRCDGPSALIIFRLTSDVWRLTLELYLFRPIIFYIPGSIIEM